MSDRKHKEMDEVLRQEKGRGRRYVPSQEEKATYKKRKKEWKDILRVMSWEDVATALLLRQGTREYAEYYQIWRDYRRDCDGDE